MAILPVILIHVHSSDIDEKGRCVNPAGIDLIQSLSLRFDDIIGIDLERTHVRLTPERPKRCSIKVKSLIARSRSREPQPF